MKNSKRSITDFVVLGLAVVLVAFKVLFGISMLNNMSVVKFYHVLSFVFSRIMDLVILYCAWSFRIANYGRIQKTDEDGKQED